jgi:hypothetical protein
MGTRGTSNPKTPCLRPSTVLILSTTRATTPPFPPERRHPPLAALSRQVLLRRRRTAGTSRLALCAPVAAILHRCRLSPLSHSPFKTPLLPFSSCPSMRLAIDVYYCRMFGICRRPSRTLPVPCLRFVLKLTTHRTLVTDNRTPPCAASGAGPAYTHAHMSAPHPGIPVGNSLAPHAAPMHHAPAQTYHQAAPHYPGAHTWHYNPYPDAITEQGLYAKGVTPYGLHG